MTRLVHGRHLAPRGSKPAMETAIMNSEARRYKPSPGDAVKTHCTEEGCFFSYGAKQLGPFKPKDMADPNFEVGLASQLGVEAKAVWLAKLKSYEEPLTVSQLARILASTVKRDEPCKLLTFLGMLLAQTEEDQYNIAFQAESSTGKSYIPLELIEYFPPEERRIYAGASPTSFFHEVGQWDPDRKVIRVDLDGKILLFMDQPHWMLMEKLRPLLSHDRKVLTYKITDKRERAGLRTKTVELLGYPTVVFCTARPTQEDQEKTRLWLLSPETSQEKLRESLWLIAQKEGDRGAFREWLDQDPLRRWLQVRVDRIRTTGIREVVVPGTEEVLKRYLEGRSSLKPRDQRDFPRLLRIIKALALLNCFHREEASPKVIAASQEDVDEAFKLYGMVAASNELGLSPETYEIYIKVIVPLASENQGVSRKDMRKKHYEIFGRHLQRDRLERQILPSLESAGLISQEPNPDNKREILVYPTVVSHISPVTAVSSQPSQGTAIKEYVGRNSGVGEAAVPSPLKGEEPSPNVSISAAPGLSTSERLEKLAEGDVLARLRTEWKRGSYTEFEDLLVSKYGYAREEAERLRERWLDEGLLAYDPEGWLVWVT